MSTLWLALGTAVALSPSILGTVQHVVREPWKAASVFAIALLVLAVRAARDARGPFRPGQALWVVAAVGFQLVASATNWDAGHRVALALGVIGFLRTSGLAPLGTTLWVLPAIPPPTGLAGLLSPTLENALGRVAGLVPPADASSLTLHQGDTGLVPMLLGGAFGLGLAWHRARPVPGLVVWAAVGVVAGFAVQVLALLLVGALHPPLAADAARGWLDLGPGCLTGAIGAILLTTTSPARPDPSHGECS